MTTLNERTFYRTNHDAPDLRGALEAKNVTQYVLLILFDLTHDLFTVSIAILLTYTVVCYCRSFAFSHAWCYAPCARTVPSAPEIVIPRAPTADVIA